MKNSLVQDKIYHTNFNYQKTYKKYHFFIKFLLDLFYIKLIIKTHNKFKDQILISYDKIYLANYYKQLCNSLFYLLQKLLLIRYILKMSIKKNLLLN